MVGHAPKDCRSRSPRVRGEPLRQRPALPRAVLGISVGRRFVGKGEASAGGRELVPCSMPCVMQVRSAGTRGTGEAIPASELPSCRDRAIRGYAPPDDRTFSDDPIPSAVGRPACRPHRRHRGYKVCLTKFKGLSYRTSRKANGDTIMSMTTSVEPVPPSRVRSDRQDPNNTIPSELQRYVSLHPWSLFPPLAHVVFRSKTTRSR